MSFKKPDIHTEVTNQIINLLDQVNFEDYEPPFAGMSSQGLPSNPTTQKQYQGVNILSLWFNQQAKEFTSNEWATFKQWKDKDAQVKKGEKGSRVIFYKTLIKSEENSNGETEEQKIPMLKTYTVFNANQVEGYAHKADSLKPEDDKVNRIKLVDEFCSNTKAKIEHLEDRAFYSPKEDFINMPKTYKFLDTKQADATENYYSTLLHELCHWTGAKHRLNREMGIQEKEYAFEELVAELGSAFLCAKLGITQKQPEHHALYIKSWLASLKNDGKYIFRAAAKASMAFEYLNSLQVTPTPKGTN